MKSEPISDRDVKTTLHFETSGKPDNPAVLFLHGFMGALNEWSQIVEIIRDEHYCIAVDLPGHGQSVNLADPTDYTMEGASTLLTYVLRKIDVERTHVVGYSMGGRLAVYFVRHHSNRCRSLVLESASPGLRTASDREARNRLDEARAGRLETEEFAPFLEDWFRQPLFSTLGRQPGLLERLIAARMGNSPDELARSLRNMGTGIQPTMWEDLEHMPTPTLGVAGALDGKFVEIAEQMAVLMPNMRTVIIPNAGHNVHAESPAVFGDLLKDFFKQPFL